jgi:transcriptional regulator with XRE-family HTH domain
VDEVRIGRLLRALRVRRGWRQLDVALGAGVSQSLVSLIERGHLDRLSIYAVRRVFAAVEARFEGDVTWRGGAIDRLLDERHARLVGSTARELTALGWRVELEVTFNEYGDRGAIDLLALRGDLGLAVVVEIKSELTAVDETLRRLDVKERLAPKIVADRFGWRPRTVGRLLVVFDSATNRRRVAAHDETLVRPFPSRGAAVRRWLHAPVGRLAGLRFSSATNGRGTSQVKRRLRAPATHETGPGSTPVRT